MFKSKHLKNGTAIVFAIFGLTMMYLGSNVRPLAIITNAWTQTESSRYGFSIEHPAKWVAREYGEGGYRSHDDVKLTLNSGADPGFNNIWIQKRVATDPTVEDVANWGEEYLLDREQNLIKQGEPGFEELEIGEEIVNGERVIMRKYTIGGDITSLDVYIARKNDMIIITLQTTQGQFDKYVDDFMRIVNSFTPMQ